MNFLKRVYFKRCRFSLQKQLLILTWSSVHMFTLCCHHLGDLNLWNCMKRWRSNWFGTEAQRYLLTQDFASTSQPSGEKQKLYKKLKWSVSPCFWRSLLQKTKGGRREQGAPLDKLPSSSQWNLHLKLGKSEWFVDIQWKHEGKIYQRAHSFSKGITFEKRVPKCFRNCYDYFFRIE